MEFAPDGTQKLILCVLWKALNDATPLLMMNMKKNYLKKLNDQETIYVDISMIGEFDAPVDMFSFDSFEVSLCVHGEEYPCNKEHIRREGTRLSVCYVPEVKAPHKTAFLRIRYFVKNIYGESFAPIGEFTDPYDPEVIEFGYHIPVCIKDKRL